MSCKFLIVFSVLLIIFNSQVRSETKAKTEEKSDAGKPVIDRSSAHHHPHDPTFHGFWKKKFVWRPRWVKTWQEKKVYVAVWKRMWGPVEVKEWVPVPKPPPGWIKHDVSSYVVKTHPHVTNK
ncbi:uncharacterized protein LOC133534552 [Cydia pomonella]|uniref:uncharacterized protein LOC133534552 n=1 Tax=Cydia pomonella TaxID=82600 RepID=UPI002ADD5B9E|nr:uncharacterized protein LOC133534552 [Cydia pomonella]